MKKYLVLFSVLLLAFFVRFYNFSNRITFGSEQARSLIVSAGYIQDKPSLLGQEYFRANSLGHKLFTSALFNYTLVPLLLLTNYDPYYITIYFALLNIFTGIVLYNLSNKIFGQKIAFFAAILFLFNNYMIYHSMFIWVLNYLPLIGIISFYLIWKIIKKHSSVIDILFLGILSGIGFGLEYLYVLPILIIFYLLLKNSVNKLKSFLIFIFGGLLGDFPQVIFDLRHDFYHLTSLYQYALDTFNGNSDAGFVYYHFLYLWPIVIVFIAILISVLYRKNKLIAYLFITTYLFLTLNSNLVNFSRPVGMVDGLKYEDIKQTSKLISEKVTGSFNVVTLYDFDTRGYVLRYFVKYVYGKTPQNEIEYKTVDQIFVLSSKNYDFINNNPWELNVYKPYNISEIDEIGNGYGLFMLKK